MAKEETKKTVKQTTTKPAVKTVKKEAAEKVSEPAAKVAAEKKPVTKETVKAETSVSSKATGKTYATVSIDVIDTAGKVTGKVSLPGEMFGEKLNKALIAQAVRVYLANQR